MDSGPTPPSTTAPRSLSRPAGHPAGKRSAPARALTLAAIFGLAAVLTSAASAQQVERIVAVVNDEIISNSDLLNRARLLMLGTGMPDTPENRNRSAPQVLRTLIDERLQLQEGQRVGAAASDAEIDDAFARVEQSNRMRRGQLTNLLRENNIPRSTMEAQFRAAIIWQKIVQRRLRALLEVGDDEIDEVFAKFNSSSGVTENLLGEIFLSVDSPEQDEEVHQTALNLLEQMKRGVSFPILAQQFSQSASAAAGGDIGWVPQRETEDEADRVIARLSSGEVSQPIRSVAGYYIYVLRDRRTSAAASPNEAIISLAQLTLPLPARVTDRDIQAQLGLAEIVRGSVSGCADWSRVAQELGAPAPTQLERLKVGDLSPVLRPIVAKLKVGEASEPMRLEPGIMMVMVCGRQDAASNLPSRDDIAENLLRQRLDLASRRYLRDLRRAAVLDVRY